jgi:hypothetical protein
MPVKEGGHVLLKLGADRACGVPPETDLTALSLHLISMR